MRRGEQKVTGADTRYVIVDPVTRRTGSDDIEFITQMRRLRAFGGPGGEADFQIAIDERFGGTARLPRHRARGGQGDGKRRLFHVLNSSVVLCISPPDVR